MNVFHINGGNKRAKIISQVQANTFQRLWVAQNKQMFFVLREFPKSELGRLFSQCNSMQGPGLTEAPPHHGRPFPRSLWAD